MLKHFTNKNLKQKRQINQCMVVDHLVNFVEFSLWYRFIFVSFAQLANRMTIFDRKKREK